MKVQKTGVDNEIVEWDCQAYMLDIIERLENEYVLEFVDKVENLNDQPCSGSFSLGGDLEKE